MYLIKFMLHHFIFNVEIYTSLQKGLDINCNLFAISNWLPWPIFVCAHAVFAENWHSYLSWYFLTMMAILKRSKFTLYFKKWESREIQKMHLFKLARNNLVFFSRSNDELISTFWCILGKNGQQNLLLQKYISFNT